MNIVTIQIIASRLTPEQLAIRCKRLYGLRTAHKIGDIETVNHTVLGKLKGNSLDITIRVL